MAKDNIYYALRERLQFTEKYAKDFLEYVIHKEISAKASREFYRENPLLSLLHRVYYLPLNILKFFSKIGDWHRYSQSLKEIEILKEELRNYDRDWL